MIRYLAQLSPGRTLLWCYLIWYLVVLGRYFDPSPHLWLTSLGTSLLVGLALYISTTNDGSVSLKSWQVFRLFLTPFCVSSFAALVKGQGFILIFSPRPNDIALGLVACLSFVLASAWAKRLPAKII